MSPSAQGSATALLEAAREGDLDRASALEGELAEIDPGAIEGDAARIAFWVNLYNARVLHEFGERPRHGSLLRQRRLFCQVGYTVGGDRFTLDVIEHGLLRLNARPAYSLRRTLGRADPRLRAAPSCLDPRIHFALNCAAASCPPVRSYAPESIDEQLETATAAYLQAETRVERGEEKVWIPYLLKLYKADFGGDRKEALRFVRDRLPGPDGDWLRAQVAAAGVRVRWADYDWTIVVGS